MLITKMASKKTRCLQYFKLNDNSTQIKFHL